MSKQIIGWTLWAILIFLAPNLWASPNSIIHLFLDENRKPVVEYQFAQSASETIFTDSDPQTHVIVRERLWAKKQGCARLDRTSLVVQDPGCGWPKFSLYEDGTVRDRRYPPLISLRNGGYLIFTQYLQVMEKSAPWNWVLEAPPGGIVSFRGEKSSKSIAIDSTKFTNDFRGWIYIGPDSFDNTPDANVLVDEGISIALGQQVAKAVPTILSFYTKYLGAPPKQVPTVYITWNGRDLPGRNVQADVAGGVIRFGLNGKGWATPDGPTITRITGYLAHELAHFWNDGVYHIRGKQVPWLSEGNAELMSISALVSTGQISDTDATERVNALIAECTTLSQGRPWSEIDQRNGGRFPYACGFSVQLALVVLMNGREHQIDSVGIWRKFWSDFPQFDEENFMAFISQNIRAEYIAEIDGLFHGHDLSLPATLERLFKGAGMVVASDSLPPPSVRISLGTDLIRAMMRTDCEGPAGFSISENSLTTNGNIVCKTFKPKQIIRYLNGIDIFDKPGDALIAAKSSCGASKAITLNADDGFSVMFECDPIRGASLPTRTHFYNVNIPFVHQKP